MDKPPAAIFWVIVSARNEEALRGGLSEDEAEVLRHRAGLSLQFDMKTEGTGIYAA